MKRFIASVVLSVGLGILVLPMMVSTQARASGRPGAIEKLERTGWWVELKMEGQPPAADALVFDKGMFDSYRCRAYGFGKAKFTAAEEGKVITFTSTAKSRAEGTMVWDGKVEGNAISGRVKWTPASGRAKELTFAGTRHKPEGRLDAAKWKVELMPEGGEPMPDTLAFRRGMFDSIACHQYGFGWGPYDAKKVDGATTFTAFTISPDQGMMMWTGEVKGDAISGTLDWYPAKGKEKKLTFRGTKEAEPRR